MFKNIIILTCPENCEISYDPTIVPRFRLWINMPGAGTQRWVGSMYQNCTWFVNHIDPNNFSIEAGEANNQIIAWEQMLEAAQNVGWDI